MSSPTRKRVAADDTDINAASQKRLSKRQKPKQKLSDVTRRGNEYDGDAGKIQHSPKKHEEQEPETPFGEMDAQLISDYMARQIKRFEPNLSVVELEDRRVPGQSLSFLAFFLLILIMK